MPDDVTGLKTLQFHAGGLMQERPVDGFKAHLVRFTGHGTPGPTLCGIDRFAKGGAGWSVAGGVVLATHEACEGCRQVARAEFAGLPVTGLGSEAFDA